MYLFNEKLREYRKKNGYTQKALAEKLDTFQQNIAKWESGQSTPDLYILAKIAVLFKTSLDDLVLSDEQKKEIFGQSSKSVPLGISEKRLYYVMPDDSMKPIISKGNLVVVKPCKTVGNGKFCVASFDNSPVMLRQIFFEQGCCILKPANSSYPSKAISKQNQYLLNIWGEAIEIKKKW